MNLQSFYKFRKIFLFIICLSVLSVILLISLSGKPKGKCR